MCSSSESTLEGRRRRRQRGRTAEAHPPDISLGQPKWTACPGDAVTSFRKLMVFFFCLDQTDIYRRYPKSALKAPNSFLTAESENCCDRCLLPEAGEPGWPELTLISLPSPAQPNTDNPSASPAFHVHDLVEETYLWLEPPSSGQVVPVQGSGFLAVDGRGDGPSRPLDSAQSAPLPSLPVDRL